MPNGETGGSTGASVCIRAAEGGDPHYGREASITPQLIETRRRYADACRAVLPEARRRSRDWLASAKVLAGQLQPLVRQFVHAATSAALMRDAAAPLPAGEASLVDATCIALDEAGTALKALGEESVLLAFHRAGDDLPEDRYSVRLAIEGSPTGIQESAASPSAALAKALAARAARRASLAAEGAVRAEIAARMRSAPA